MSNAGRATTLPERLHTLDVLRGLAALTVVLWHWQHFFYDGTRLGEFDRARQPFYEALSLLYRHGALAVSLFFAISGFIFFWLYSDKVVGREISARNFAVLRASRLYPLHLATFILVVFLQMAAQQYMGGYLVYPANDWYHAALNLTFTSAWGLENGWSFNAPVWSVSVEVLLYLLFFVALRWFPTPFVVCAVFIAIGMSASINDKVDAGLRAFFAGGLAYMITTMALQRLGSMMALVGATFGILAAWTYVGIFGHHVVIIDTIAFPATVAWLAIAQAQFPHLLKRYSFIGELSYSTYLLHFPLQMVFLLLGEALGIGRSAFYAVGVFAFYFAILIALGLLSYRLFEAPAQKFLRRALMRAEAERVRSNERRATNLI